ncbi:hypothetical protein M011DRAFT_474009 [Sporormia fimetaria CBS 119925]|uniref:Uncharacterized protein n=1 Tax=Sporormia fimetaria CBS 119925 TaxID=1340428 RepID=A0A6A6VN32_9PLEO|nr:hypothetical protein M011DRAFT_474009 [Sporormia fimetaria CBS 119925]
MSPYNSQSISFCPTPRTVSNGHFPAQIETKSVHPYTWNITSSGESSPVDNYNGNHHAYMQNHPSWEQQGKAYNTASTLIPGPDFDTICDQAQARLRAVNARVTATGPLSPLNLTSIQSALPSPMKQFYNSPQRQSPIPLRKAGHHTDALQAQRLQASEDIYGLSKPNMGWHPELVIRDAPSGLPPSATPTTLAPQQSTTSSATQGSTLPYASLSPPENPASTTQPQLTFHTSLMDILTIPTVSVPNYSHFRNHSIPTSSSADNMSVLAEQPSQPNLYCFDSDSKVTAPSNSATEAILVSGQPYTPLLTPPNESKQAASSSGQDAQIRVSTKPSLACRL